MITYEIGYSITQDPKPVSPESFVSTILTNDMIIKITEIFRSLFPMNVGTFFKVEKYKQTQIIIGLVAQGVDFNRNCTLTFFSDQPPNIIDKLVNEGMNQLIEFATKI